MIYAFKIFRIIIIYTKFYEQPEINNNVKKILS